MSDPDQRPATPGTADDSPSGPGGDADCAGDQAPPARVALGTPRSPDEPAWTRLLAPLRSEDAAFRALLVVAGVCGAFAVVVVLVRALT